MPEHAHELVSIVTPKSNRRCLACGDALPSRRRRYCAMECQQHLLASLNRRTGLLQALRTRYATFYFTDVVIMMDVLLYGTEQIHSYMLPRSPGSKPVEDFRHLSNILGNLWWYEKHRTNKRYLASRQVLQQAYKDKTPLNSVMPAVLIIPSVKASNLIRLKLDSDDLSPANLELKIKSAYRRQAMKHHPDMGGSQETFLKIQEAYEKLTQWANRPTFIHQRGFPDKWFYEGARNRWIKPIAPRKRG
jgi:predicted nucleic acid-binding Zn ribbon protein